MGLRDWLNPKNTNPGKAAKAKTPPMQVQAPKYAPKKSVRAINPKKKRG